MSLALSEEHSVGQTTRFPAFVPVWANGGDPFVVRADGEYTCGSNVTADFHVSFGNIAPEHCTFRVTRGVVEVHVGEQQVWVNDIPVFSSQTLRDGDLLAIGAATFRVETLHESCVSPVHLPDSVTTGLEAKNARQKITDHLSQLDREISRVASGRPDVSEQTGPADFLQQNAPFSRFDADHGPTASETLVQRTAELQDREARLDRRAQEVSVRLTRLADMESQFLQIRERMGQGQLELTAQQERIAAEERDLAIEAARLDKLNQAVARERAELQRESELFSERQLQVDEQSVRLSQNAQSLSEQLARLEAERQLLDDDRSTFQAGVAEREEELRIQQSAFEQSREETAQEKQRLDSQWNSLRDEAARLDDLSRTLEERRTQLDEEYEAAQRQLQDERSTIQAEVSEREKELRNQQTALEHSREESAQEKLRLETQWDSLRDEATRLEDLSRTIDEQRAQLSTQHEAAELQKEQIRQQTLDLSERETVLSEQRAALQDAREKLEEERKAFEVQTTQHQQDVRNREESLAQAQAAVASDRADQKAQLDAERIEIKQERERLEQLQRTVEEDRTAVQKQRAEINREKEEVDSHARRLAENADSLSKQAAETEAARNSLGEERSAFETEVAQIRAELKSREEALSSEESAAERNAKTKTDLQQLAESLAQKEQSLGEREAAVRELTVRADQMNVAESELAQKTAELESRSVEINERAEELAARIVAIKKLRGTPRNEEASAADGLTEQLHETAAKLEETSQQLESTRLERDELSTALAELKTAFESASRELKSREGCSENNDVERNQRIEALAATVAEKDQTIESLTASLRDAEAQRAELADQIQVQQDELKQQNAELQNRIDELHQPVTDHDADAESALLRQIEDLQSELSSSDQASPPSGQFNEQVRKYEATIQDLTVQLAEATASEAAVPEPELADLTAKLEERDQLIADLKSSLESLQQHAPADAQVSEVDVHQLHRELDERTNLLDQRDAEIRERSRQLENTEGELEAQRRQLLEARQQLELARAEIQVAFDAPGGPTSSVSGSADDVRESGLSASETADNDEESSPQLRSELADLFGISTDRKQKPTGAATDAVAREDYTDEVGSAVSLSFAETHGVLIEDTETPPAPPETVEDGDDFVASYMEQLLARNRGKAGGALPEELAQERPKKESESKPGKEAKKPVTSFIDSYLAGDSAEAVENSVPDADATENPSDLAVPESAPRPKIDREAMRSKMDSFRQVSTQSVEKALASHAMRKERSNITTRAAIFGVLALMTLFVILATLFNVIQFSSWLWLLILGVAVSGGEFVYKVTSIRRKVTQLTRPTDAVAVAPVEAADQKLESTADNPDPQLNNLLTGFAPESDSSAEADGTADINPVSDTVSNPVSNPVSDEEEEQYFEL